MTSNDSSSPPSAPPEKEGDGFFKGISLFAALLEFGHDALLLFGTLRKSEERPDLPVKDTPAGKFAQDSVCFLVAGGLHDENQRPFAKWKPPSKNDAFFFQFVECVKGRNDPLLQDGQFLLLCGESGSVGSDDEIPVLGG